MIVIKQNIYIYIYNFVCDQHEMVNIQCMIVCWLAFDLKCVV